MLTRDTLCTAAKSRTSGRTKPAANSTSSKNVKPVSDQSESAHIQNLGIEDLLV